MQKHFLVILELPLLAKPYTYAIHPDIESHLIAAKSLGNENLTDRLSIVICITIEPEANK